MRPFRADSARGDAARGSAALLVLLLVGACASTGLPIGADGRYYNEERGYSIDAPRLDDATAWRMVSLDDTDLAWRTEDGRSMSLSSSCKRTRARPALLARQLLIGVPRDAILSAHPVALRGDPGWAQTVETGADSAAIRIKTVTVVGGGCVYDWVLVAAAGPRFDESLPVFDDWWTSFERPRASEEEDAVQEEPGADAAGAAP